MTATVPAGKSTIVADLEARQQRYDEGVDGRVAAQAQEAAADLGTENMDHMVVESESQMLKCW